MSTYPEGVELEDVPCPLGCPPGDEFVLEGRDLLHGIPGRFPIVRCTHCGLMRTNPRPTPATIGAYYPSDYGPYSAEPAAQPAKPTKGWKRSVRRLLDLESKKLPDMPPGRMLEVGCASGAYLAEMREAGWTVEGIEFSDVAASAAASRGIPVQCATVENARDPEQLVDVVTAWMVLEHLHEPVRALERIRSWTRPGGYLVASVPDAGCALGRAFGAQRYDLHLPNHLYHYTPETLRKVLHAAGWKVERIRWQKNSNNLLRSIGYVAQSRDWNGVAKAAAWVAESRQAGKLRALLSWTLGATRQSGRMEFWARPI